VTGAAAGWRWAERHTGGGVRLVGAVPDDAAHPPALLVHGLGGGAWYWARWQALFAERGRPAWALDLRGRAGSRHAAAPGRVRLAEYVDDVREAAASLREPGLGEPAVVGHSLGGLLAQAAAEAGLARALVLVCSMPPRGIGFATPTLAVRQLRHLGTMLRGRPLVASPADIAHMNLHRVPAAEHAAILDRFVPDSGIVARELSLGGLAIDAARVRCPVLVQAAAEDRFFPPTVQRRVAARYGAELRVYERHAHFVVMEPGWEELAGDAAAWLARQDAAPRVTP
jgi:pimeloyl-ACP methyl ester carboxylesterase